MSIISYVLPLLSAFITPDWMIVKDIQYGPYERNLADLYILNDKEIHPTVIFIHGGGWAAGDKDYYKDRAKKYALAGFNVVSLTYTFANQNKETQWPAQERDISIAIQWVRDNAKTYGFDVNKLVVGGDSAGGHLAMFMGYEHGVKVIQDMFGPSDLTEPTMAKVMEGMDVVGKQSIQQNAHLYIEASPIFLITKDYPSTFIAHSIDDKVIPYSQSENLYKLLNALGIKTELVTYHGYKEQYGGHNLYGVPVCIHLWVEMRALWFTIRNL